MTINDQADTGGPRVYRRSLVCHLKTAVVEWLVDRGWCVHVFRDEPFEGEPWYWSGRHPKHGTQIRLGTMKIATDFQVPFTTLDPGLYGEEI
jgi:hypothetical protein